jgi:hypothetical protein
MNILKKAGGLTDIGKMFGKGADIGKTVGKIDPKTLMNAGDFAGYAKTVNKVDDAADAAKAADKAAAAAKAADKAGDAAKKADDAADAAKKADAAANAAKKADDAADAAKKADDAADAAKKADDAADAAKKADDAADAAKKADDAADAAKKADNAGDAAKKADDVENAEKALQKNSKIVAWMKKNPGKTALAAAAAILGAVGLAYATKSFESNKDKQLGIIKMEPAGSSSTVLITYNQDAVFVKNDKIEFSDSNMIPPHKGDQFDVVQIINKTSITVNIPDIMVYATSGTIILKTTVENRIADTVENGTKETGELLKTGVGAAAGVIGSVAGVAGGLAGNVLGPVWDSVKGVVGPYLLYAEGCCALICCFILIMIIWKIVSMFS